MKDRIAVIGSGFAGLAAATSLAQKGFDVDLYEKNEQTGGRARKFESDGFVFDMGPSWYWMPDVFEDYFSKFGKKPSDYYKLKRIDPSYKVIFGKDDHLEIPASLDEQKKMFEKLEPGSSKNLDLFLEEARYKYEVGMKDIVYKPALSIFEFFNWKIASGALRLHLLKSFSSYIRKFFSHPKLLKLLEFPVLFLGAKPEDTPALYSIMNYADMKLGTWYPMGGMHEVVKGMTSLAEEMGVKIHLNSEIEKIVVEDKKAKGVVVNGEFRAADAVVAGADYHHVEQKLLEPQFRNYSEDYWGKRTMAPSCLLYYVGVDKKLDGIEHHNLFFDEDFAIHSKEIYDTKEWPKKPLFYVCAPSKTDPTVAPEGKENVFILIPVAPGLKDNQEIREKYYNIVCQRLANVTGCDIREHSVFLRSYAHEDFVEDYNAFRGNAYGLANTLNQTAFLKPSLRNKIVSNIFYTGQLTTPGPGVPPSLISGQVAATAVAKHLKTIRQQQHKVA
ncbi:phytoene desaturase family protein [Halocola ammonii]